MRPAITTAFARASGSLSSAAVVDVALRADAGAAVLDAGLSAELYPPLVAELQRRGDELPILGLEAPGPVTTRPGARAPELTAPDRDEAQAALAAATETVRRAGALRAPFVILRLGEVRPVAHDWPRARDCFLRGELDAPLAQRLLQARDGAAERALDAARRTLERLAREAERAGVVVLVRNGRRYVDVPTPRELDRLRQELSGAPLMPMLDVAAAHLTDVMGFWPLALTLAAHAAAPLCYFGDACGPVGALAPGRGIVDLAAVRAALAPTARLAFNPWAGLDVDEVIDAMRSL